MQDETIRIIGGADAGIGLGICTKGGYGVECEEKTTLFLEGCYFRDPAFPGERIAMLAGMPATAALATVARGVLQVRSKPDQRVEKPGTLRDGNKKKVEIHTKQKSERHTKGSAETGTSGGKQPQNRASAKEQTQSKHSMLGDSGGEQPKDGVSAKKQAQSENSLLEDAKVVFAKHRSPDAEEMFQSLRNFMVSRGKWT